MDIKSMEYVAAIAKHGSLTRAAEKLYISQPALTKFLQQHEKELGFKLFKRVNRRLVPTGECRVYLEYAEDILSRVGAMESALADITDLQHGKLTVAFSPRRGYIHATVLPAFLVKYPNVEVETLEVPSRAVMEKLYSNEADLVMSIFSENERDAIQYEKLFEDELLLCIPGDRPIAKNYDSCSKLNGYPLLNLQAIREEKLSAPGKNTPTGRMLAEKLQQAGFPAENIIEISNSDSAYTLCASGFCGCFLYESYIRHHNLLGKCAVYSIHENSVFSICYRKDYHMPRYARAYIDIAKEQFGNMEKTQL